MKCNGSTYMFVWAAIVADDVVPAWRRCSTSPNQEPADALGCQPVLRRHAFDSTRDILGAPRHSLKRTQGKENLFTLVVR